MVNAKLNISQQCALVARVSTSILSCIRGSFTSRSLEVILSLCSALVRPHVEHWVQFWASQLKTDMDILGGYQAKGFKRW